MKIKKYVMYVLMFIACGAYQGCSATWSLTNNTGVTFTDLVLQAGTCGSIDFATPNNFSNWMSNGWIPGATLQISNLFPQCSGSFVPAVLQAYDADDELYVSDATYNAVTDGNTYLVTLNNAGGLSFAASAQSAATSTAPAQQSFSTGNVASAVPAPVAVQAAPIPNCQTQTGSICSACALGYQLSSNSCTQCTANSYSSDGITCQQCPANSVTTTAGATSASQCACANGYYGNTSQGCNACPLGAVCQAGATTFTCPVPYIASGNYCVPFTITSAVYQLQSTASGCVWQDVTAYLNKHPANKGKPVSNANVGVGTLAAVNNVLLINGTTIIPAGGAIPNSFTTAQYGCGQINIPIAKINSIIALSQNMMANQIVASPYNAVSYTALGLTGDPAPYQPKQLVITYTYINPVGNVATVGSLNTGIKTILDGGVIVLP